MQKWEYKIVNDKWQGEDDLNKLGDDGWELVAIIYSVGWPSAMYYFKRLKS